MCELVCGESNCAPPRDHFEAWVDRWFVSFLMAAEDGVMALASCLSYSIVDPKCTNHLFMREGKRRVEGTYALPFIIYDQFKRGFPLLFAPYLLSGWIVLNCFFSFSSHFLSRFIPMLVCRLLYTKGCAINELVHSEIWRRRVGDKFGPGASFFGCVLFLKEDLVDFLRDEGDESPSLRDEGDLLAFVLKWARGGRKLEGERLPLCTTKATLPYPSASLGPWAVIERCMGDPCSFGVVAGFVSRCVLDGSDGDGNRRQRQCIVDGFMWEWEELVNCTTLSQLSLYVDSPISVEVMKSL